MCKIAVVGVSCLLFDVAVTCLLHFANSHIAITMLGHVMYSVNGGHTEFCNSCIKIPMLSLVADLKDIL